MNSTEYIINDISPLKESNTIGDAQELFTQTTYSHVPVMKDETYVGCLAENDVHCHKASDTIAEQRHMYEGFFVRDTTNWLDVIEAFAQNNTNLMPVLNNENRYIGYYELGDVMNYFHNTPFLSEPGSIIVIEKNIQEYSFSEISQIIESSDGRVLGAFISQIEDDVAQISIKIGGHISFNDILQSFRRYGYHILSNHQEDAFLEELKERSQYLERYLNI